MPSALVTGSAGFVGQRMIPALQARGFDDIVEIDIKNGHDARDFFHGLHHRSTTRFDLVVHLAALVGGRALIEGNPLAVAVDLEIDAALFQWAVRTQQLHILYFSSSAAYPVSYQTAEVAQDAADDHASIRLQECDIDLDAIEHPDQTYGLAKLVGEIQAREARKHGVMVTIARPFSGTGTGQTLDYPVPAIIDRAVRREDPLTIWSDSVRDFVDIDDVVDASLDAVELGIEEPFNIGTGIAHSFSDIALYAARAVGYEPQIVVLDGKAAGVAYRVADPTFLYSFYRGGLLTAPEIVQEMVADRLAEIEAAVVPA